MSDGKNPGAARKGGPEGKAGASMAAGAEGQTGTIMTGAEGQTAASMAAGTEGQTGASPEKPVVRISVRNLVEFILRAGDIDSRTLKGHDVEAALAGGRIHRRIQKSRTGDYSAEYALSRDVDFGELVIRIEGRADGLIGGDVPCIEEIKGMYLDVTRLEEPFPVHLAQAKCYAAIYAAEEALPRIAVRMTYVNLDTEEIRFLDAEYEAGELEEWFLRVAGEYRRWAEWQLHHARARDESMRELPFPFEYREGQRKLTHTVFRSIRDGRDLFLMAPTGVGKTMSCVYPAVRAVGEGCGDRIFYLTARNETLNAGREAFSILAGKGLDFRTVLITSKEKICPLSEPSCNPDDCPYARGHFDRINDAVFRLLGEASFFGREEIRAASVRFQVCPFELTLDLASWCDAVLGDYNYVFDPNARLKRFFGNGSRGDGIFLIDEAHNLVERGRQMFSARLVKEHVLAAKRACGKDVPYLAKALDKVNRLMLKEKHLCEEEPTFEAAGRTVRLPEDEEFLPLRGAVLRLYEKLQEFYQSEAEGALKEKLLDFYFETGDFVRTLEYLDDHYEIFSGTGEDDDFGLTLFCVNPSARLTECVERGRCAVFFSATLLPVDYYRMLLTTKEDVCAVYAESPFDTSRRIILAAEDVSTRYSDRNTAMYRRIAAYIAAVAGGRRGNYLVFFPSYKLMRDVFRVYRGEFDAEGVNWVLQTPGMREDDREIFLENFYEEPRETLIGFCVMGGMFSEGIDLTGTRLIGAVVVGAGIPQISGEREIVRRFFDRDGSGFDCAYRYPGMNKVQQAAGRVIRTSGDEGVIALLDGRFLTAGCRRLFPREWNRIEVCRSAEDAKAIIREFWKRRQ